MSILIFVNFVKHLQDLQNCQIGKKLVNTTTTGIQSHLQNLQKM